MSFVAGELDTRLPFDFVAFYLLFYLVPLRHLEPAPSLQGAGWSLESLENCLLSRNYSAPELLQAR